MRPIAASDLVERREFLRSALRYSALAGVAGVVASAVARRAPLNGPACGGTGICGGCAALGGCQAPRAASARGESELVAGVADPGLRTEAVAKAGPASTRPATPCRSELQRIEPKENAILGGESP